ncbi:MAG: NUDIX hydrolase [Exiguobacterium profundum]|nr:MAG: NUDIX hydrolase [Exiguobacterium profundum]
MTTKPDDFVGAKAAFFCGAGVLVYQRDDRPDLRWPGMWDLPGGGREGGESAEACLLRELDEEFGLRLAPERLVWRRVFPSLVDAARRSVFFAGFLRADEVAAVRFGDEGQRWEVMPRDIWLTRPDAVAELQRRTHLAWQALTAVPR